MKNWMIPIPGTSLYIYAFTKICVAASLETLHEDLTVRIRDKQAAWKLLSKISRTTPADV